MVSLGGGKWRCLACGFVSKSTNVKYLRVQAYRESWPHLPTLQQFFRSRNALNTHLSTKHKQINSPWSLMNCLYYAHRHCLEYRLIFLILDLDAEIRSRWPTWAKGGGCVGCATMCPSRPTCHHSRRGKLKHMSQSMVNHVWGLWKKL